MKKLKFFKKEYSNQFENVNSLLETNLKLKKKQKITKNQKNQKLKMTLIKNTTKRKSRKMK